jgi:hypothetical protein
MILDQPVQKGYNPFLIDLNGPFNNYYYLLGLAQNLSHQMDMNWSKIREELQFAENTRFLTVMEKYFPKDILFFKSS